MLLSMVEVISCENPDCREFGKVVSLARGIRSYYCPICGIVSGARAVDANLANSPEMYKAYLRNTLLHSEELHPLLR
jgi:hypothetical protein